MHIQDPLLLTKLSPIALKVVLLFRLSLFSPF